MNSESTASSASQKVSAATLLQPLWTRKWALLTLMILVSVATYMYYSRQANRYKATSTLLIGADRTQQSIQRSSSPISGRQVQNEADVASSRPVAARAARELRVPGGAAAARELVTVTVDPNADIIRISAEAEDAVQAATFANAFADSYLGISRARSRELLNVSITALRRKLDALGADAVDEAERADVSTELRNLELLRSSPPGSARLIEEAVPAVAPFAPRPERNALFALALSALFGVLAAYGLDRFDRRLRSVDDVEALVGATVLSALPHVQDGAASVNEEGATVRSALREPMRMLRANLQMVGLDEQHRTVLVSSAIPGEGKSTVARNLALTYCDVGYSVALVDADLRRPTLAAALNILSGDIGLTSVLTGDASLEQALLDVPLDPDGFSDIAMRTPGPSSTTAGRRRLSLLPAGSTPANPQAVLASVQMRRLVERLAATHDIVIVDTPPLLAVSDALSLAAATDCTVIVTRLNLSTRDSVRRLLKLMDRAHDLNVIGFVVNDITGIERVRGYGYYEYYGQATKAVRGAARDHATERDLV